MKLTWNYNQFQQNVKVVPISSFICSWVCAWSEDHVLPSKKVDPKCLLAKFLKPTASKPNVNDSTTENRLTTILCDPIVIEFFKDSKDYCWTETSKHNTQQKLTLDSFFVKTFFNWLISSCWLLRICLIASNSNLITSQWHKSHDGASWTCDSWTFDRLYSSEKSSQFSLAKWSNC